MRTVFDAVWDQAKRCGGPDKIAEAAALKLAARAKQKEIDLVKAERDQAKRLLRRSNINGAISVLEMHNLEWEACRILCPDLDHADWQSKKRAWSWVLKQPWGEEYRPPAFEKVNF